MPSSGQSIVLPEAIKAPCINPSGCFREFYLNAVADLEKICEHCGIIFRQHLQDPATKTAFATNFCLYNSFKRGQSWNN
jgi:hypothetical protein